MPSTRAPAASRRIYSETLYPRLHLGWSDLASLVDARDHYIHSPRPELYDVVGQIAATGVSIIVLAMPAKYAMARIDQYCTNTLG